MAAEVATPFAVPIRVADWTGGVGLLSIHHASNASQWYEVKGGTII